MYLYSLKNNKMNTDIKLRHRLLLVFWKPSLCLGRKEVVSKAKSGCSS